MQITLTLAQLVALHGLPKQEGDSVVVTQRFQPTPGVEVTLGTNETSLRSYEIAPDGVVTEKP